VVPVSRPRFWNSFLLRYEVRSVLTMHVHLRVDDLFM
jgi:hypothetical protein